jgi:alanyl-tRNA synthetase
VAGLVVAPDVDLRASSVSEAQRLNAVVGLASGADGTARVAVAVPKELASVVDARKVVNSLLAPIGGKGGGSSAEFAQGGGRADGDLGKLLDALPEAVGHAASPAPDETTGR